MGNVECRVMRSDPFIHDVRNRRGFHALAGSQTRLDCDSIILDVKLHQELKESMPLSVRHTMGVGRVVVDVIFRENGLMIRPHVLDLQPLIDRFDDEPIIANIWERTSLCIQEADRWLKLNAAPYVLDDLAPVQCRAPRQ